jgi:plastocyanin
MNRFTITGAVCVIGAATAAGLLALPASKASKAHVAANAAAPAATGVVIEGFAFNAPAVRPGETVSVSNDDSAPHTVTASEGGFKTPTIGSGQQGTFTAPNAPGTYAFFCAIHPSMTGTLVVR